MFHRYKNAINNERGSADGILLMIALLMFITIAVSSMFMGRADKAKGGK